MTLNDSGTDSGMLCISAPTEDQRGRWSHPPVNWDSPGAWSLTQKERPSRSTAVVGFGNEAQALDAIALPIVP